MDYYKKTLYIPQVDENDRIIGKVERWEAHQKGILHRAFDVALLYENKIICQIRKHPVYNGTLTFTATSHQYYDGDELMDITSSIYSTLQREWNIRKEHLVNQPESLGKIYYRSTDGIYTEHEVCHLYVSTIDILPAVNFEYSYGYALLTPSELKSNLPINQSLAPWVKEALRQNLL